MSETIEKLKILFIETVTQEHSAAMQAACGLLNSLSNYVSDFIYVKNTKGKYVVANEAHKVFLKGNPAGRSASEFFPKALAERYAADDNEVITGNEPIIRHERRPDHRTLEPLSVVTVKVPIHDKDGKVTGIFCLSYPTS